MASTDSEILAASQTTGLSLETETLHLDSGPQTMEWDDCGFLDWTEEQKQIIEDNIRYYKETLVVLEEVKTKGPRSDGKLPKLPKKPKFSIKTVYKKKETKVVGMTPQQLHLVLSSNIAEVNVAISREVFSDKLFTETVSESIIVERLLRGVRNIKRQDAQTLMFYIQFGNFLNLCQTWHGIERKDGRIKETWAKWLKRNTDYSDDHARKLRAISSILFGYPKFYNVGLPLSFIIKHLSNIKKMLNVPEFNTFWKENPMLPPTAQLQQSQDV